MNPVVIGVVGVLAGACAASGSPTILGDGWPPWLTSPVPKWESREAQLEARLIELGALKAKLDLEIEMNPASVGVLPPGQAFGGARIRRYSCDASGPIEEGIASCDGTVVFLRRRSADGR